MADDFADVVARLYSVPPDEFIAERDDAVGAARRAGDKELAARIGKLRKPTIAAWLVNLLSHQRPDLIGELLALGADLRDAQRELRGDALRQLSLRRRATVSTLAREARDLAVAAGRPVRDKLPLAEVEQTLTAALADAYIAGEVRAGTLTKPMDYAGFGELPRPRLRLVKGGVDEPPPIEDARPVKKPAVVRVTRPTADVLQNARAMKTARREMLAASLQLVDAQAKRDAALKALAAAEEAIAAAQQRADEAKATLDKLVTP